MKKKHECQNKYGMKWNEVKHKEFLFKGLKCERLMETHPDPFDS